MQKVNINISPKVVFTIPIWGGIPVSNSVCVTWFIMVLLIIMGLIIRYRLLPKFTQTPKGLQNVIELFVDWVYNFSHDCLHDKADKIAPYIGTLVLYLALANTIELIGLKPPTTDISTTFALAIITFFLINYYGIREKGLLGRIKDIGRPVPAMAPIKVFSDMALPISMASRLFGNMLGGLVVMELIYKIVPIAIPAFLAIYFNLFDGLMQTFIFATLTLTFVGEAVE